MQHFAGDARILIADTGFETEKQFHLVAAHLLQGVGCIHADGWNFVGQRIEQVTQGFGARKVVTLDESQGAGTAQDSGGIFTTAPDRLQLHMANSYAKDIRFLDA